MNFEVGDSVNWLGLIGEIEQIREPSEENNLMGPYTIKVKFPNHHPFWFTTDGRSSSFHTEPSLKFIERVKKESSKDEIIEIQGKTIRIQQRREERLITGFKNIRLAIDDYLSFYEAKKQIDIEGKIDTSGNIETNQ